MDKHSFANRIGIYELIVYNRAAFLSPIIWYLLCMIYVYGISIVAGKLRLSKAAYAFSVLLLFNGVVMEYPSDVPWYHVGNFIFMGIPLFYIGRLIHIKQPKKRSIYIIMIIAGEVINLFETYFIKDMYMNIGTVIISMALLLTAISYRRNSMGFLADIGRKYSMIIFIVHTGIGMVIEKLNAQAGIDKYSWIKWCIPLVVLGISYIVAYIVIKINSETAKGEK